MKTTLLFLAAICLAGPSLADELPGVASGSLTKAMPFKSTTFRDRSVYVWLPPGFSDTQRYDVLYMQDGNMLFDANATWNGQEWKVDEVVGGLIREGRIRPIIVVGIPNAGAARHAEYFPQKPFEALPETAQDDLYDRSRAESNSLFSRDVYSDSYAAFIVNEVVPYIEGAYPVSKGREHRYLAGSSMGGLISWYVAMEYPDYFAGVISMSTHWPGDMDGTSGAFDAFRNYIEEKLPSVSGLKIYFDYGDQTLDQLYPPLQKQIDQVFVEQRYSEDDWISLFFPGANHSEVAWAQRLAVPLQFMFGVR